MRAAACRVVIFLSDRSEGIQAPRLRFPAWWQKSPKQQPSVSRLWPSQCCAMKAEYGELEEKQTTSTGFDGRDVDSTICKRVLRIRKIDWKAGRLGSEG